MNIIAGDTVAIQGLGGLGHLAIQYAAKMGYRVAALSSSGSKERFAKELGAHDFVDMSKEDAATALQKIGGAALVVATAPNPEAMAPLIGGLAPGGKLLVLARKSIPPPSTPRPLSKVKWRCCGRGLSSRNSIPTLVVRLVIVVVC